MILEYFLFISRSFIYVLRAVLNYKFIVVNCDSDSQKTTDTDMNVHDYLYSISYRKCSERSWALPWELSTPCKAAKQTKIKQ